jgi:hypothetical protein
MTVTVALAGDTMLGRGSPPWVQLVTASITPSPRASSPPWSARQRSTAGSLSAGRGFCKRPTAQSLPGLPRRVRAQPDPQRAPHLGARRPPADLTHPFNWKKASMAAARCYGVRGGGAQLAFHVTAGNYDTDRLVEVLKGLRRFLGGEKATLLWDGLPSHRTVGGCRGWRLATLRPRGRVHGLHRAGALRTLLRRPRLAWPHHPHRQQASALPAGGVGLVVSSPSLIADALRGRQQQVGADTLARSWAAQLRLCRRFRQLERRKHSPAWPWSLSLVSLPGSCGPRCRPDSMPPVVGGSPIGAAALASARTRRSTAVAGKIPASSLPRPRWRDATSLRQLPAQSRLAVPTREHQSGGLSIHAAPTRS